LPIRSPILYAFYDADVVQGRINKSEGSTGFIDDYNAWVTETNAVKNTRKLQTQLLYRAEDWARENSAVLQHLIKLSLFATDHPLQGCISWFPLRGSAGSSLRRTVYEMYEGQLEPENRHADHQRPLWGMLP
jgi:hypothetical protein